MKKDPRVDGYLREVGRWREGAGRLRGIALRCGLTEEFKWGKPCYALNGGNVVIIQAFKEYFALMFCKGALLKDPKSILKKPGEHTQAARQIRFTTARELEEMEAVVTAYVQEAAEAQRRGLEVAFKRNPEPVPDELKRRLGESPALKAAFSALTPGRQRGYILFISSAKQSATRERRIEGCLRRILSGKGLGD
jgi:uncharacterized protein YdeI (YjbR/CyaY-like superfamily)